MLLPICNGRFSDAKNQGNLGLVETQLEPSLLDVISPSMRILWDFRRSGGSKADATERQRNPEQADITGTPNKNAFPSRRSQQDPSGIFFASRRGKSWWLVRPFGGV